MADRERFDADPDPTFHADEDPDPKFFLARERKKIPQDFQLFFPKSYSNNSGGGVRGLGDNPRRLLM